MEIEWISVKDKLPPNGDKRLLVVIHGYREDIVPMSAVEIANYTSEDSWILEEFTELTDMQVTHWMPLPEPPKEAHT